MPCARSRLVSSATGYCALATAMPYPGAMTTERAALSISAVSATVTSWYSPPTSAATLPPSLPKPPRMTEMNLRFIALHMR